MNNESKINIECVSSILKKHTGRFMLCELATEIREKYAKKNPHIKDIKNVSDGLKKEAISKKDYLEITIPIYNYFLLKNSIALNLFITLL